MALDKYILEVTAAVAYLTQVTLWIWRRKQPPVEWAISCDAEEPLEGWKVWEVPSNQFV